MPRVNAKDSLLAIVAKEDIFAARVFLERALDNVVSLDVHGNVDEFLNKLDFEYDTHRPGISGRIWLTYVPYARWIEMRWNTDNEYYWAMDTARIPDELRNRKNNEISIHSARIKSISADVDYEMTPSELLAHHARISNPSNEYNHETAPKLLVSMKEKSEWSSFEMIDINIEIYTTRDIARQILRHRSFSFQEFSQRYANPVSLLGFAKRQARLQDKKNRQSSIETDDANLQNWWSDAQQEIIDAASRLYSEGIERGIAKEQTRALLPEGLTVSRLYMKGSPRQWIHYVNLRTQMSTQAEHRMVANSIKEQLIRYLPIMVKVLSEDKKE